MKKILSVLFLVAILIVGVILSGCGEDKACAASYGGSYGGGYRSYSSPSYSAPKSYSYSSPKTYSNPKTYSSTPKSPITTKSYSSPKSYNGYKSIPRSTYSHTRTTYAPGYERAYDPINHLYYYILISELASNSDC